ncbi:rhodanese-like domain-containing protein [Roseovarius sp. D22-M7]|uniref:rhodanese-like domain-containing protein n=1 Tax=Roseovarius sp. D22-M7 TaxID=3127116 RepID=UPI00301054C0
MTRIAPTLLAFMLALAPLAGQAAALDLAQPVAADSLPDSKLTDPGLYITAAESGRVLSENDNVALLDVRSPSETMLIGYPTPTAANIPFKIVDPDLAFNAEEGVYKMLEYPDFSGEVTAWLASDAAKGIDTLVVICRSGSRSASAVDALTKAGVDATLYSMVDGFEGDKNDAGTRDVNGWRNAGLPWTYKIREGLWPGHH